LGEHTINIAVEIVFDPEAKVLKHSGKGKIKGKSPKAQ
jgi:hypothetical protein